MEVRQLIAALGTELAPLESLIAQGVAQDPDFFLYHGDEVKAALMLLVQGLLASAPQGRVLIEPSEESSGIAVNNLGGNNSITLKNSYRRRAYAFIEHLKDVHEDGSETLSRSLVKELELAPVSGFQGVLGTIGGYFAKDIAYARASRPRRWNWPFPPVSNSVSIRWWWLGPGSSRDLAWRN